MNYVQQVNIILDFDPITAINMSQQVKFVVSIHKCLSQLRVSDFNLKY